jgi:hypothetical protein
VTPDAVFYRWWELRAELEAPPPQIGRWTGSLGIRPSPHCARCGADATTWREDPLGPLVGEEPPNGSSPDPREEPIALPVLRAHCRRCGGVWILELAPVLTPAASAPLTDRISELRTLGTVLELLEERHRRIYLQLYLLEKIGDHETVAETANARWPLMHPPVRGLTGPRAREWSRHTVGLLIREARGRITDAMMDRGLWRFS